MNIPKDVYEYLAGFADDKTILNMLSVNKKIRDEDFFKRIFNRKYPLLIKFKKDNETWKYFYLSMVQYIAKLEEEFDIPYISTEGYNPKDFYKRNHDNKSVYNMAMVWAAFGGQMEIVDLMVKKGANDFNTGMVWAAEGGQMEIVKLMIEKGATDFNWAMESAAKNGHMEIVKLMVEKGANKFNWAMERAAEEGHMEIVKLMAEKDVDETDLNWVIKQATKQGQMEIVDYLKSLK